MINVQLSKNFWLSELVWSDTAARMGREVIPTEANVNDLRRLCVELLQPIRDTLNRPMTISSGLRPQWLNELTPGSSPYSEHVQARAADFSVVGMTPYDVTMTISNMGLSFQQLIHEFGRWTHISIAPAGVKARLDVRTASAMNGKTIYSPGVSPV